LHTTVPCLKCWNNFPWTLTVHESACLVDPNDYNVQPKVAACCCVWWISALVWIGDEQIPRVNSDLCWAVGALFHSTVDAVRHGMWHKGSPPPKKFKTQLSGGTNEASMFRGHAIAQAVSCQLPTTAARVLSQVRSCGICGAQSGTWAGYLRVLQFSLPIFIPPNAP
jgi:hypothetical protein